ncbi:thiamine diphosphokinase [Paenibacillus sp. J5C2022]|uniref:thiamine diphosphokinase n=1 Tax=Paenibacillus sp. J5C2022 TaxID=2977129 RepID=UPI0021D03C4E|nr:thiamine diphosphokinase [Paenibacillus sp. J5C2022]
MNSTIIIATGGTLGHWAIRHIPDDALLIGADSGAVFLLDNGRIPAVAIGDFDSITDEEMARIRQACPTVITCDPIDKNYTDTEMAFQHAMAMKPREIVLLGAIGTRFDHSLANVHLLALAEENGIDAKIIDEHNEIRVVSSVAAIRRGPYDTVSLLPLSQEVTGITLSGFQYPLRDASLTVGQSLGISNVLLGQSGTVQLASGRLIVIQSRD